MGRSSPDVAIVGMSCVMPGAPDVETFWANIVDGVDSVTEVSPSRWDPALHYEAGYDPAVGRADGEHRSASKWGGWIPDVGFDPLAWGIPPASLASIDPAQLLALKVAAGALEDAGYGPGGRPGSLDRDRTSVVYATGSGGAVELSAGIALRVLLRSHGGGALPPELDAFLPQITPDALPGVLTSVIAGRVANRLDLGGKNFVVDSACASALAGLDIACTELLAGSSHAVLCGAVDLHNGAQDYISFTAAGTLSPRGRCRSYAADADGMTLAEGAGCLLLKRLADAERDGDRIYAVVKGVAGSSDGRHLGLTAPRQEGQVKAVRRAYAVAGVSPAEIGLVEGHGTGTAAGDGTELRTMTETFLEAGAAPGSVVLGAVKSNIGHIKCAAGIASLIKAAKSAYHGVLPPTLHLTEPNDEWDPGTSPFVFLDQARPWLADQRLVGVSGFGFGGTNFHAILRSHASSPSSSHRVRDQLVPAGRDGSLLSQLPPSGRPHWPVELFVFRAPTPAALDQRLAELSDRLDNELEGLLQTDRWRLRDIAAAESQQGEGPVQLAIVAASLTELRDKVTDARHNSRGQGIYWPATAGRGSHASHAPPPLGEPPEVAFLFAAASEARLGMGADVLVAFPHGRNTARAAGNLAEVMAPPQAFGKDREQQEAALSEADEWATATASVTTARTLMELGVSPTARVGLGQRPLAEALTGNSHRGDPRAPEESFADDIRELSDHGVRVFVEVGPGHRLAELASQALAGVPHLAVATDLPGQHGLVALVHTLAQLAVAGVPVDIEALHAGRGSLPHRWLTPAKAPGWVVNGHCARSASGEPLPKGLRPADQAPPVRVVGQDEPLPDTAGSQQMAVVAQYLSLVNEVVAHGSDMIRSQLAPDGPEATNPGAPPAAVDLREPVAGPGTDASTRAANGAHR